MNEYTARIEGFSSTVVQPSAVESVASTGHAFPSIRGLDLFAGAGGFSLGAIRAGIDIAGALELNENAAWTYMTNIRRPDGSCPTLIQDDILLIDPSEAMRRWKLTPGAIDVIIGGPPCQGFSSHRINNAGVDDPRNLLLGRYFEYVEAIRPRLFLVENVPGLLWDRHRPYLDAFYLAAANAGYDLTAPVVINARDYGVPQNRRRVFLLGIDHSRPLDISWPPPPTHVSPDTPAPERGGRPDWHTARDAFASAAPGDPNDIHMQHSREMVELFSRTPPNGGSRRDSGRILPCHKGHNGHSDVYGRINPDRPGPTMTTACINPSKGRFVHPTENHGITLRQAARIQTFPDEFIFQGGLMSGGEQIGNAVPVALAFALLHPITIALSMASLAV